MNSEMLQLLARSKQLSTIRQPGMTWADAFSMVLLIAAVIFVAILLR
jgi:hypothetical protein